ncbi:hypothetical protein K6119_09760 [Paracrocinitomix mangrovi]|uniref:hypothetical protein n=1 Tax=Paracrocinitomix mangrovi TaxID=2862509 RepID=UPI001C8D4690|nr:hypothetical protein [Paracrocinitomix mangrovi]UKN03775.1 hypothetical protein K6119_09760 [Paracrocinitomix mangrovi]
MRSAILISLLPLILWNNSFDPEFIWGKYCLKFPEGGELVLTFKSDSTFYLKSFQSNAIIENQGVYEVYDDSVFLTYTMPSIQNSVDTFANKNHFHPRKDTLWIIDENEIATGTDILSERYYQFEKHFEDGSINIAKEWELRDSSLIQEDSYGNKHIYVLRGRRIKRGVWKYYNWNGELIGTE